MSIPLFVTSHRLRKEIPGRVISLLQEWKASRVFADMEYEVDELRRDISVTTLGRENGAGIEAKFVADKLIVEPLSLATNSGTQYAASGCDHFPSKPTYEMSYRSTAHGLRVG